MTIPTERSHRRILWTERTAEPADGAVVFFPYAGGSASAAKALAGAVPTRHSLVGVQYPGRGARYSEPVAPGIGELAAEVAVELTQLQDPILLFGHSFGALVAFEVAQRLVALDRPPVGLVVSSAAAPGSDFRSNGIHLSSDEELAELVVRRGGTPPELLDNRELIDLTLPSIRHDFKLAETYRPESVAPLDVPVAAIGGDADEAVSAEALDTWQALTAQWLGAEVRPGGHFYYLDDQAALAKVLAHARFGTGGSRS